MKVSAAILAGGRPARFDGRGKRALVVDGCTILDRQLATLPAVADDVTLVGAPHDLSQPRPNVRVARLELLADVNAPAEPAGLETLQGHKP